MTDELYDYFGGNASKKVEPIEDDDLDLEEDEVEIQESVVESDTIAQSNQEEESMNDEPEEQASEPKKAGHWDFLANMLGISGNKTAKSETPKATVKAERKPKSKSETKPAKPKTARAAKPKPKPESAPVVEDSPASQDGKGDFFGFDPIPSPEEDTVLPSMFAKKESAKSFDLDEATDDIIGWNPAPPKSAESKSQDQPLKSSTPTRSAPKVQPVVDRIEDDSFDDDDELELEDGEEFVEFEIEELDNSPIVEEEEEAHGRRRRRPPAQDRAPAKSQSSPGRDEVVADE
ncbi:MAG: hypothetical protein ACI87E_004906, partial [Mariniblastus sp.]